MMNEVWEREVVDDMDEVVTLVMSGGHVWMMKNHDGLWERDVLHVFSHHK